MVKLVLAREQRLLLDEEHHQRKASQDERQRCRAALVVLRADDGKEDVGGQHRVLPAHDDGVAEVSDAFDEADQEGVGQARAQEPAASPCVKVLMPVGAQRLCAASSRLGLMPATTPRMIMNAMGVKANICASHTPKQAVEPACGRDARKPTP